ncbi:hypothetical protein [Desertibacillus haloalkaliphilus]|uniref:hypothetical protein n=1 Tax=Desertibacillus haloalkaliphilus TaxID=1328930 RepID=UPI001C26FFDE|nr:hypothetical protein [Desertibacillus haloalkaliphilus]MBU8908125.1 hypothetical protein [Desertibacillus haloalkaliphilus]
MELALRRLRFPEGKIKNLKYAIRAAAQDALRDACDHFQMGWVDLGKTSSSVNSTHRQSNKEHSKSQNKSDVCMVCKTELSQTEVDLLKGNGIKLKYCNEHLPKHFFK